MPEYPPDNEFSQLKLKMTNMLNSHGISTAQWGTQKAKTLEQLVQEILNKECQLIVNDHGELVREAETVYVAVRCLIDGIMQELVEDRQEFADGRIRERG